MQPLAGVPPPRATLSPSAHDAVAASGRATRDGGAQSERRWPDAADAEGGTGGGREVL